MCSQFVRGPHDLRHDVPSGRGRHFQLAQDWARMTSDLMAPEAEDDISSLRRIFEHSRIPSPGTGSLKPCGHRVSHSTCHTWYREDGLSDTRLTQQFAVQTVGFEFSGTAIRFAFRPHTSSANWESF
eukprot:scpid102947/ scgid8638/ 